MRKDNRHIVEVFKTSVQTPGQVTQVGILLSRLPGVVRHTVDLDDCDKVLRIECTTPLTGRVSEVLQQAGFYCQELV